MDNMANELIDREFYKLKDGIMHQHFKDFTYKWNENRIYCAKVTKEGEYQWIRWNDNKGYDLNSIKRGGRYNASKNAPHQGTDNRQNLLQGNKQNEK